jgi:glycosyltransferase involved in cell wall biosynthesis
VNEAPTLRLVVPCYREAGRLRQADFLAFLAARPNAHLLFVDDGSDDGTAEALAALCQRANGRARVLRLDANRGKAEAVRRGLVEAQREGAAYLGWWDADLAAPLSESDALVEALQRDGGLLLAMGSRVKMLGRRIERRALRHYVGRVFATAASLLLRLGVYDTQCGAKVFRDDPRTRALFAEPFRSRWLLDVEVLLRMEGVPGAEPARSVIEVPLGEWRDVPGSKVRWWTALGAFRALAGLWWRHRVTAPARAGSEPRPAPGAVAGSVPPAG